MKNYQTTYVNNTSLSPKCQVKPSSVQDRILRRIVEKRQAQADHRRNKVMVPNKLEPLFWQKDLEFSQNEYIFALKFNN